MEFAFLDESGDRGLKGSKYLVTTLMCTSKSKEVVKIIREAKQSLLRKNKTAKWLNRNGGEIKFYGFPDEVLLRRILGQLAKLDIKIYSLIFEKDMDVTNGAKVFLLGQLFQHIFSLSQGKVPQKISADAAFYGKEKIYRFLLDKYNVSNHALEGSNHEVRKFEVAFSLIDEKTYQKLRNSDKMILAMEQCNSKLCEELQALDIISGAIFHKYEKDEDYLFNIIEPLIKEIREIKASDIRNLK